MTITKVRESIQLTILFAICFFTTFYLQFIMDNLQSLERMTGFHFDSMMVYRGALSFSFGGIMYFFFSYVTCEYEPNAARNESPLNLWMYWIVAFVLQFIPVIFLLLGWDLTSMPDWAMELVTFSMDYTSLTLASVLYALSIFILFTKKGETPSSLNVREPLISDKD